MIRGGIISSKTVNSLSWIAQIFYHRLLLVIDDMALFEADADVLRSSLFPRNLNQVSVSDVEKLLSQCEAAGLVRTYEVKGVRYLWVKKFGQKKKFSKPSIYPPPPENFEEIFSAEEKRIEEEVEKEVEVNYARPRFFLKEINPIAFEQLQMKSGLNGEFDTCIEQWSLSVEGESGEKAFRYSNNKEEDYRILTAKAQKWINSWVRTNREKTSGKKDNYNKPVPQTKTPAPYVEPKTQVTDEQKRELKKQWWKGILKEFEQFKKSGQVVIATPLLQIKSFEDKGLLLLSTKEKLQLMDEVKEKILSSEIKPENVIQFRKSGHMKEAIRKNNLSTEQENEIKSMAAETAIINYYEAIKVEEFKKSVNEIIDRI